MNAKNAIVFLLFYCAFCSAQQTGNKKVDSLFAVLAKTKTDAVRAKLLAEIAVEHIAIDAEKGLEYGQQALAISNRIGSKEGKTKSYFAMGRNHFAMGQNTAALAEFEQALAGTKNQRDYGEILRNIGIVYMSKANFSKASEYCFRALKISEQLSDRPETAQNYQAIANIYNYTNETQQALSYYNKALKINTDLKLLRQKTKNLQNIAALYSDTYQDSLAVKYFKKAAGIANATHDVEGQILNAFQLGKLYADEGLLEKALPYITEARLKSKQIKNYRYYSASNIIAANIYIGMVKADATQSKQKLATAESLLNESVALTDKGHNLTSLSQCYKMLSEVYALRNQYKISRDYYVLYHEIRDSIYNSESKETIKNLEDKRLIELKNKQIQVNALELESSERQQLLYLIGILALGIIGGLLYYQNRNRRKTNRVLQSLNGELDQANQVKARFLSILNHDLRSPVTNLLTFMHLQHDNPDLLDSRTKKQMESTTITAAENLLESMEDILFWSKSQMEQFNPIPHPQRIDFIFGDLQKHFSSTANVSLVFENRDGLLLVTDENYLKAILRNLISNAIKALRDTADATVVISAKSENKTTLITVTDNGPGIDPQEFDTLYKEQEVVGINTGLGLHLIRDLAKAIDCTVSVESKPGAGTTFVLAFASSV